MLSQCRATDDIEELTMVEAVTHVFRELTNALELLPARMLSGR